MRSGESAELAGLPGHFRQEQAALRDAGVTTWEQLSALSGERLRAIARPGGATESRLLRLRAQARLMAKANLTPQEASLLLHAGLSEARALAEADPQRLQVQVNRLRRRLLGAAAPPLTLATVRGWIRAAGTSRSAN